MRRALAAALLLLAACRTAAPVAGMPVNFGVVEEGRIYRGAQPGDRDLQALQKLGIHTIVKLNGEHAAAEAAEARRLGMNVILVPLSARSVGTRASCGRVEQAYAALTDPAAWPVYVHCSHGRDRTGFLVGLFRERAERWDWSRVSDELARYGHDAFWRRVFPNISRSLSGRTPACAADAAGF